MKTEYIAIAVMIVFALVLFYFGYVSFLKNKGLKQPVHSSSIDIETLVKALGGIENIQDVSFSPSKLTVILMNQSVVDIVTIQGLGASGIVEGKNTLSMIFGRQSEDIASDLKKKIS